MGVRSVSEATVARLLYQGVATKNHTQRWRGRFFVHLLERKSVVTTLRRLMSWKSRRHCRDLYRAAGFWTMLLPCFLPLAIFQCHLPKIGGSNLKFVQMKYDTTRMTGITD